MRNSNRINFEMVVVDAHSDDGSYQYFENLALILNGSYKNKLNEVNSKFINEYRLKQFIVNSNKYSESSFIKLPYTKSSIMKYDRSCIYIKIFRQKKKISSNIARQICVEKSCGIYIWQIDPDDMINTQTIDQIINKVSTSNQTDLIEFSFYYHTLSKSGRRIRARFKKKDLNINSNYGIVKQFLTNKKNQWQLWQCIVRREIYLKAIEKLREMVPDNEKVKYASDLLHYVPITYYCNSYSSLNVFGYHYFYRNNGSISLMTKKNEIDTRESKKIIFGFIENLFNNSGIPIPKDFQVKNIV